METLHSKSLPNRIDMADGDTLQNILLMAHARHQLKSGVVFPILQKLLVFHLRFMIGVDICGQIILACCIFCLQGSTGSQGY